MRLKAIRSLGKMKIERAVRPIGNCINHEQANLRKEAAAALGEIAASRRRGVPGRRRRRCRSGRPQERPLGAAADRGAESASRHIKARAGAEQRVILPLWTSPARRLLVFANGIGRLRTWPILRNSEDAAMTTLSVQRPSPRGWNEGNAGRSRLAAAGERPGRRRGAQRRRLRRHREIPDRQRALRGRQSGQGARRDARASASAISKRSSPTRRPTGAIRKSRGCSRRSISRP